jgi:SAM-dependent methyltransferase
MFNNLYYLYQRYIIKRLNSEQRIYFDNYLIPKYVKNDLNILFIGIAWYNKWIFKKYKKTNWVTIDPSPESQKFGAQNHTIGNFPNDIKTSLYKEKFDIIIFNGVYGWGINCEDTFKKSIKKMYETLKPNGLVLFGYNTEITKNPISKKKLYDIIHENFISHIDREIQTERTIKDKHIFCILQKLG